MTFFGRPACCTKITTLLKEKDSGLGFNFSTSLLCSLLCNVSVASPVPSVVKHATHYLHVPQEGVRRRGAWWPKTPCHCIACIPVPGSCWPEDYLYSRRRGPSWPAEGGGDFMSSDHTRTWTHIKYFKLDSEPLKLLPASLEDPLIKPQARQWLIMQVRFWGINLIIIFNKLGRNLTFF